jgi:hypothetical protein
LNHISRFNNGACFKETIRPLASVFGWPVLSPIPNYERDVLWARLSEIWWKVQNYKHIRLHTYSIIYISTKLQTQVSFRLDSLITGSATSIVDLILLVFSFKKIPPTRILEACWYRIKFNFSDYCFREARKELFL